LEEIASAIRIVAQGSVTTLQLDVTNPESVAAAAERLSGVDVLVNKAGVARTAPALAQAAARAMRASTRGWRRTPRAS